MRRSSDIYSKDKVFESMMQPHIGGYAKGKDFKGRDDRCCPGLER